jgi:CHAD domain-containing protein
LTPDWLLRRSIGALRNTDVLEYNLSSAAAKIGEFLREELNPLFDALAERRREEHKRVTALLKSARFEALVDSLSGAKFKLRSPGAPHPTAPDRVKPLLKIVWQVGHISSPPSGHLGTFIACALESDACAMC